MDIDPTGVAEDLVKREVSLLDIKNSEGKTPLEIAFERNYANIIKLADELYEGAPLELKKIDNQGVSIQLRPDATVIKNKFRNFLLSAALSGGLAYAHWNLNSPLAVSMGLGAALSCGTTIAKGLELVSEFRASAYSYYYLKNNKPVLRNSLNIDQQRVHFYTSFCSLKEYYGNMYKAACGGGLFAVGFAIHGFLTGNNISKLAALGFGATAIQSALKGGFVSNFKSSSPKALDRIKRI